MKRKYTNTFYTQTHLFEDKEVWQTKGVYFHKVCSSFKLITQLDPWSSKNSKITVYLVLELYFLCSMPCIPFLVNYNLNWSHWDKLCHITNWSHWDILSYLNWSHWNILSYLNWSHWVILSYAILDL